MIPTIDDTRQRPWTDEHDAILVQLRKAGLTLPRIAERLGRTSSACSSRAIRLVEKQKAKRDYLGERINALIVERARECGVSTDRFKKTALRWTQVERPNVRRFG